MNVTDDEWEKIEAKFRTWSFGVYYNRTFADERESHRRFVKALLASARPIRDRQAVLDWYQQRRRRRMRP